ncbi:TRAP transporter small permease [Kiloniella sp. b19]|uniref:TRAP transporter small permease n=1 Tax=Kiloniella sp. GXU_MW_B19 TaxID=3141326 RepID=UPI0031D693D9
MSLLFHKAEEIFISFLLAAMTLVTFSQVVARYIFNSGAIWALELTTYFFAWLVLFGISYGVRVHAHIGVDAFVKLFNRKGQKLFGILVVLACLTYGGLLVYGGYDYVYKIFRIGIEAEDLPVPQWVPLAILPVGFGLLIIRLLQAGWHIIADEKTVSILGDESKEAIDSFMDEKKEDEK